MPRTRVKDGLICLFRRNSEWEQFEVGFEPMQIDSIIRSCKATTASPWVWVGPAAIGAWMMKNPGAKENTMPAATRALARRQLAALHVRYQKTTEQLAEWLADLDKEE